MENDDISFVTFLASLDMDEVVHEFRDQLGLDNKAYQERLFYYVY